MGNVCRQSNSCCDSLSFKTDGNDLVAESVIFDVRKLQPIPHSNIDKSEFDSFVRELFPDIAETIKQNQPFMQFLKYLLELRNDESQREKFVNQLDQMILKLQHNSNLFETGKVQEWKEIYEIISKTEGCIDHLHEKLQSYQSEGQAIYVTGPISFPIGQQQRNIINA